MEPRLATLLGDSSFESSALDPTSIPPPSAAPRRPHPVEPTPDDAHTNLGLRRSEFIGNDNYFSNRSQALPPSSRYKSGVPIAEVLNEEAFDPQQQTSTFNTVSTQNFSGRLSDILLDPLQHYPNKRRKVEKGIIPSTSPCNENNSLKLPKLPQLPKKTTRRPRIPPLLQGLHQPPPLPPEGRLFPPITGESGGFRGELGDSVVSKNGSTRLDRHEEKAPDDDTIITALSQPVRQTEEEEDITNPLVYVPASAKGTEDSVVETERRSQIIKSKAPKKRHKWSEQETKDLLVGVSRFGIGNWKKILQCSDYEFKDRTAVDLKDRFRTCCPGKHLRHKDTKEQHSLKYVDTHSLADTLGSHNVAGDTSGYLRPNEIAWKTQRKPRVDKQAKGPVELAQMGIHGPFKRNSRRKRREFTAKDDENLIKGFEKHGALWRCIRDDSDLDFNSRHPTDLRDRFRNRYPEKYAKAGYKLQPKNEKMGKQKVEDRDKDKEYPLAQELAGPNGMNSPSTSQRIISQEGIVDLLVATVPSSTQESSNLRAHALHHPLPSSFPTPLEDFRDLMSEDGDESHSPMTLNRNIFEWADANPPQSMVITTSSLTAASMPTADTTDNWTSNMDTMHIDPLATLKLAPASLPSLPSFCATSNLLQSSLHANSTTQVHAGAEVALSTSINTPTSQVLRHSLLRTPNLPTIVFPHVPAASARGTVHNLPPPSDLLSGVDAEARLDSQTSGLMIDDTLSLTLPVGTAGVPGEWRRW